MKIVVVVVFLLLLPSVATGSCPNGTSTCISQNAPGNNALPSSIRGCCPYVGGTCCSDGLHCCPPNEACHAERGFCVSKINRPWQLPMTTPAIQLHSMVPLIGHRSSQLQLLRCDDSMACSTADDARSTTCCPGPYIGYDCCPLADGICCEDFLHCCPTNTTCNVHKGECTSETSIASVPFYRKIKAINNVHLRFKSVENVKSIGNIKCLDNVTVCYDSDTCCPTGGGSYGCCPIPNAVCCNDFRNCCPSGMACDPSTGTCKRQNGQLFRGLPLLSSVASEFVSKPKPYSLPQRKKAVQMAEKTSDEMKSFVNSYYFVGGSVVCPGGGSCPAGQTCCPSYVNDRAEADACCPLPYAVCCLDGKHCCPYGTVCDPTFTYCFGDDGKVTSSVRKLNPKIVTKTAKTICPDHETCPDKYTCCELPAGGYGCCPYSDAVCCDDHVHCCPHGSVCDTEARGCRQGNDVNVDPFSRIYAKPSGKLPSSDRTN